MIDNFEYIKKHLNFINDKSFYFVQIIKRKKENPEIKSYSIPVESFYIFNTEHYDKMKDRIIEICEKNRARAYIKMNCLDAQSVLLEQISIITQEIRKQNWKHMSKTLNSACGICGKQEGLDKLYLIDLDNINIGSTEYNTITKYINELEPVKVPNKIYMSVPTKHGCHLLTTGFDMQKFKQTYPNIDIHGDGITLLYYPKCCD